MIKLPIAAVILFSISLAARASELTLDIQPVGWDEASQQALVTTVLDHMDVQRRLEGSHYRVLETVLPADGNRFSMTLYDYTRDQAFEITGDSRNLSRIQIRGVTYSPAPTPEEMEDAIQILKAHPYFGAEATKDKWQPYDAMPGLINVPGSRSRVIAVGIMPTGPSSNELRHEIVGVDLSRQTVIRYPTGAPPTAEAEIRVCAPPSAGQAVTSRGTAGQAVVTVQRAGQTLWKFTVIRPSASSGRWGSAIDLRNIEYQGTHVLSRAHLPILNVQYRYNVCGPYRDWTYSENSFQATGTLITSGILKADSPPTTILDSGVDRGTFRGVAIYTSGPETILVTEVSAGWYRYKSEFRLHEDGSIRPRFGFSAIQNSCTCNTHFHHGYWRFDFDIGGIGAANNVQVFNGSTWNPINTESKQYRNSTNQAWRVINPTTGLGYQVTPGLQDGTADAYGKGDIWVLKYMSGQIDDSNVYTGTSANLNAFLTGQSTANTDVVLWYGVHYPHVFNGPGILDRDATLGPTLTLLRPGQE